MSYQLIHGSAHSLPEIADKSVHCLVTSPPYFGLRKYSGDQGVDWPAVDYSPMAGLPPVHVEAMRCELGLEPDPTAYIGHLILCLREWHRILRDDGTCWVNLGDSYNGSGGAGGDYGAGGLKEGQPKYPGRRVNGLKAKELIMIPARLALAAQADGWFLRSAIVWAKGVSFIPHYAGSCMPESVQDRPTQSYEMVYMLAKQERYYFDMESVKEPLRLPDAADGTRVFGGRNKNGANLEHARTTGRSYEQAPSGRQIRSVWAISPRGYSGAHFAVFPPELPETCIRAGTSAHGVCPECGAPWRRVVEKGDPIRMGGNAGVSVGHANGPMSRNGNGQWDEGHMPMVRPSHTAGWQPTCACNCDDVVPATVLDPFNGSGTSGRAALKLGRSYIGVDISQEYLTELSPDRMSNIQMELAL